jgi:hypothetical protein
MGRLVPCLVGSGDQKVDLSGIFPTFPRFSALLCLSSLPPNLSPEALLDLRR